jgi:ribokinase
MPAITVLGSLNMDLVVRVASAPSPGQTVLGHGFEMIPGGKGANQAYAAARLAKQSGSVAMAGRVGADSFGERLKSNLAAAGVDVTHVSSSKNTPTGIATITVEDGGQNSIIVVSGANFDWDPASEAELESFFAASKFALFQLETPLPVIGKAMAIARAAGAFTILDPAPAQPLPPEILELADLLTPNETEAAMLLGLTGSILDHGDAEEAARRLRRLGTRNVMLKLGKNGGYYLGAEAFPVAPFPVTPVDTTAAGDTFNAALAVALSEGAAIQQAARFASAAAALSTTKPGAQTSAPSRAETDAYLSEYTR